MSTDNKKNKFQDALAEIGRIIKLGFTGSAGEITPADSLKDYSTDTGTVLKIDKLEVGGKVYKDDGTTPADAATVKLVDGTVVEIGADGAIISVTAPPAEVTPEMQLEAMKSKFATGTPEERIANLEAMCAALMQYCFGWKIDEATRKTIEEQAIAAYNSLGLPSQFAEQLETVKQSFKTQGEQTQTAMSKMLEVVVKLAEEPAGDPAHVPANTSPQESKKERAQRLVTAAREAAKDKV